MEEMTLKEKLLKIQTELVCGKSQWNSFNNFSFRSCEDILEAVKPFLKELKLTLKLQDELVYIGERYYIKATVILSDGKEEEVNIAYAREEETKKGFDGSQITGSSSSYARKYALNGLFLLDDTKDADTNEYNNQTNKENKTKKENKVEPITQEQVKLIHTLIKDNEELHTKIINHYGVDSIKEMSKAQAIECISALKKGSSK